MGKISVREGRVCIIKIEELTSIKEALEQLKNTIIECVNADENDPKRLDTFVFVDLSLFTSINSSVIGVLGSVLMNPRIRLLGLCGVQPSVADILTRFGVLTSTSTRDFVAHGALKDNMSKVLTFTTVEQGLCCLNPR